MTVVDGWKLDSHKTKPFRVALDKLEKRRATILLVATGANLNLERASRNLEGVTLVPPNALGLRPAAPRSPDAFARSG